MDTVFALVGGIQPLSKACGVTVPAIRKWLMAGRMPRTEWTGETTYAEIAERLTNGKVTRVMLLAKWPSWSGLRPKPEAEPAPCGEQLAASPACIEA
jgi:hypothetical protein